MPGQKLDLNGLASRLLSTDHLGETEAIAGRHWLLEGRHSGLLCWFEASVIFNRQPFGILSDPFKQVREGSRKLIQVIANF